MSLPERTFEREPATSPARSSEHIRMVEQMLEAEFAEVLTSETIAEVARDAVEPFDEVPVQTFVPILAVRTARRHARSIAYGERA